MEIHRYKIPILTYHKIDDRREWGINSVRPASFFKQMKFLREAGYQPVTLWSLRNGVIPLKPVIITFDDGYESVYINAFPILEQFGFTAVVFVISGYVNGWNTWDANLGGIRFRHLKTQQIRELAEAGFEIGSHGVTHRSLTQLAPDEVRSEMVISKKELEHITGKDILSVAYPFGLQTKMIRRVARSEGYEYGFINIWGKTSGADDSCLRRLPVYRTDSISAFERKLTFGWKNRLEIGKLSVLSWPAHLTPVYQKYFKRSSSGEIPGKQRLSPYPEKE